MSRFAYIRVDLLRGQIAFVSNLGSDAPSLLPKAAKRLEPLNLDLARETYLAAWSPASLAGHLAGASDVFEVSRAARALSPPGDPPRPVDMLPTGLVALAMSDAWRGDFTAAASLIAETDAVAEVTGSRIAPYTHMFLASLQGNQAELTSLIAVSTAKATAEGQGVGRMAPAKGLCQARYRLPPGAERRSGIARARRPPA